MINLVDILSNLFSVSIFTFYNLIQIFLASKVTEKRLNLHKLVDLHLARNHVRQV